jgi:hypothetical protein
LRSFALKRPTLTVQPSVDPVENVWREVLESADTLWYARRRNIHYKAEVTGVPVSVIRDEKENEEEVAKRIKAVKLTTPFKNINKRGTTVAKAEVMSLLGTRAFARGPQTLVKGAVNELNTLESVNRISVLKVAERFSEKGFGEGVARLEEMDTAFKENNKVIDSISTSGKVPELDRLSRALPETKLKVFSKELIHVASTGEGPQSVKVAKLVADKLKELKAPVTVSGRIR